MQNRKPLVLGQPTFAEEFGEPIVGCFGDRFNERDTKTHESILNDNVRLIRQVLAGINVYSEEIDVMIDAYKNHCRSKIKKP